MRDRIRKTAEEMGYKPNVFAVNLQRGSTRTIGIVVPMVSRNFFSVAIDGIEEAASQRGYDVMIYQSRNDPEREVRILNSFLHGKVDGVIASLASGAGDYTHYRALSRYGMPLVLFDRYAPGLDAGTVLLDDYKGAFDTVEHLIGQGYRRIATRQHLEKPEDGLRGRAAPSRNRTALRLDRRRCDDRRRRL